MKRDDRIMSEYADQLGHLLDEKAIALDRYTPTDAAAVFGVQPATVRNWIKKGYIAYETVWVDKHVGKDPNKHRDVAVYIIESKEIERVMSAGPRLIRFTV